ncbi:hypothetical protein [Allorhodopirellula heiligendammensis]|uniref:Uncharacterized protein n=1 Tax=Allorhodopirellula heiligendammensis TaxID=2714739 RepID=A0A5C6BD10_9BACT|nr:hypothetical protein [Allorhodopirellula heiligendammensis]TWU09840.1 hypothetical protein Poly21_53870 [Allorhodopirellula heiligendammensis]
MVQVSRRDESDADVPLSERGKGENMTLDERSPASVFGLVGLSYLVVLLVVALAFGVWFYL